MPAPLRSQASPAKFDDILHMIRLAMQGNPKFYLCHPDYWISLDEDVVPGPDPCEFRKVHWVHHGFQGSCRLGERPSYIRESHILWERSDRVLVYLHYGMNPQREPFVLAYLSKKFQKIVDTMSVEVYLKYETETSPPERPYFMEPHPSPSPIRSPRPQVRVDEETSTISSVRIREVLKTPPPTPAPKDPPKLVRRPLAVRPLSSSSSAENGATAIVSPQGRNEVIGFGKENDTDSMNEIV